MPKNFKFADRTNWELVQNKITTILNSLKASGDQVIDLTVSNPTDCKFQYPSKKILNAFNNEDNLAYAPSSKGLLKAREAVCDYYAEKGMTVYPENVFLTASTSEGYSFIFKLLANYNDTILFPKPSYPLFEYLVGINDLNMGFYPLIFDDEKNWVPDLEKLVNMIDGKTKAIIIVNPNNPTGSFFLKEDIDKVNEIIYGKNISLISDEVFFDYNFDKEKTFLSLVSNEKNLTFVLGGLSKSFGLPQMKLSWIVINGPKELVQEACERLEVIADTYLSVNTPSQNALKDWLGLKDYIQKEILERIKKNLVSIKTMVEGNSDATLLEAQGGWYAVLKLPERINEEEFIIELLEKEHVFVHPGYFFDFQYEPHIIVSLLCPEVDIRGGLKKVIKKITS